MSDHALAAEIAGHVEDTQSARGWCRCCDERWPCLVKRLADRLADWQREYDALSRNARRRAPGKMGPA